MSWFAVSRVASGSSKVVMVPMSGLVEHELMG